jgi:hypothetical protein
MTNKQVFFSWKAVLEETDSDAVASFHRYMSAWSAFNALYREDSQVDLASLSNGGDRARVESFQAADAFGNSHTALLVSGA